MLYMKSCEDLGMGFKSTTEILPLAIALSKYFLVFSNTHKNNTLHYNHPYEDQCKGFVTHCTQRYGDTAFVCHIESGKCKLLSLIKHDNLIPNVYQGPENFPSLGGTCDI